MNKKIGIWSQEEVKMIRELVKKAEELDKKQDLGRGFIARVAGAFYAPKRAISLLESLIGGTPEIVERICDTIMDDIIRVGYSLNLSGEESADNLWDMVTILAKIANVAVERVKFYDEAMDRVYALGRLSFLIYKLSGKMKKETIQNLIPHKGKKVTTSAGQEFVDSKVYGCSICRHRPLEAGDRSKHCSYCQPVGNDAIGSNWEPMSAIERAERLAYLGEDFDYGDIFEETVVDSILSLMESYGGYLPPLTDAEFWSQGPEFDGE